MSWDPDLPDAFLLAHEVMIKGWVRRFFAGRARDTFSVMLDGHGVVDLKIQKQANRRTGNPRAVVQPATSGDARVAAEWARRRAGLALGESASCPG